MKTIPAPIATHLTGTLTTLAYLLKIVRRDGTVLAFTTCDTDLTVSGTTYKAADSFQMSALESPRGLAPENAELLGLLNSGAITDADIASGYYDGAAITISVCNWAAPADGAVVLRTGTIGEIMHDGSQYTFEIKGLVDALAQTVGQAYTKTCRHRLGNAACTVNLALATYRKTGTLTSVSSNSLVSDTARSEAADFFTCGTLQFTSGANAGLTFDVRSFSSGAFTLWQAAPNTPAVGDAYVAVAGCDKTYATCGAKFTNTLNFGGFPHIPGADAILKTPDAKVG